MLIDELKKANMVALKNHDTIARGALSVVINKYNLAALEAKANGKEFGDADMIAIIMKTSKEMMEEKAGYEKVGNLERAEQIQKQMDTLKVYLPQMMSEEEIRAEIMKLEDRSIPSIMKHFKANFAGKVEMSLVSKVARSI